MLSVLEGKWRTRSDVTHITFKRGVEGKKKEGRKCSLYWRVNGEMGTSGEENVIGRI